MEAFKQFTHKVSQQSKAFLQRSADRHIRLAVTGLSGAGKTAFITSLVHQLTQLNPEQHLPLWDAARQQRILGIRREMQPDLDIASFNYQGACAALQQESPQWPASTRQMGELRLTIRYQPQLGLFAKLSEQATLYLDLIDYPGEWLLDLPLLKLDYTAWCQQQSFRIENFAKSPYFTPFLQAMQALPLTEVADELRLAEVAKIYQELLLDLVNQQGFYQAQPGRMLLPGELEGTPLLTFFPLLISNAQEFERLEQSDKHSYYHVLKLRYQTYVQKVVKPFYQDHFAHFDRQIVLVDCLTALNRGRHQFQDMTQALHQIVESFQFGQNSFLRRLFAPKIDKLLFAASKVDHITLDQQPHLLGLLNHVLKDSRHFAQFEGCEVETMVISAINCTTQGEVKQNGDTFKVIKGKRLSDGQSVTIYPGDVPAKLPHADFWQQQGFEFTAFQPPDYQEPLPHIRLDHLLQYILGDKLQ